MSNKQKLNWDMLEKAAAELPASLSIGETQDDEAPDHQKPPRRDQGQGPVGPPAGTMELNQGIHRMFPSDVPVDANNQIRWKSGLTGDKREYDWTGFEETPAGVSGPRMRLPVPFLKRVQERPGATAAAGAGAYGLGKLLQRSGQIQHWDRRYPELLRGEPEFIWNRDMSKSYKGSRFGSKGMRRLGRASGALKGVGGGLGLLSLYNLMRGSESD